MHVDTNLPLIIRSSKNGSRRDLGHGTRVLRAESSSFARTWSGTLVECAKELSY